MSDPKSTDKKKVKAVKRSPSSPDGAVTLSTGIPKATKDLIDAKLEKLAAATGKRLSLYTLLQFTVTADALDKAEVQVLAKLKEYEELERRQRELGIHIL
jgi:ABC-type phosphate/phosphonate transport system substrate-binding protein